MARVLDVIAVLAVAVVLLLPKASVTARPALAADPIELERVSELQNEHFRHPDDVATALALADSFLSLFRSDWALMTLAPLAARDDYRVHMTLATAHAERLEAREVVDEAARVATACADADGSGGKSGPICPPGTLARIELIRTSMQALLDGQIDPAKDPVAARDAVAKVLHSAKYLRGMPLGPAASSPARPTPTPSPAPSPSKK